MEGSTHRRELDGAVTTKDELMIARMPPRPHSNLRRRYLQPLSKLSFSAALKDAISGLVNRRGPRHHHAGSAMNVVAPAALEGDSPAAAALRAMLQVRLFALATAACREPLDLRPAPGAAATLSPPAKLWPGRAS
jgi:hypothetical protein